MSVEIVTKEDLKNFKEELLLDIQQLLREKPNNENRYLPSAEVKTLLKISKGTL